MCHKVPVIYFGAIFKFVDSIEAARVPHDGEHESFALDVAFRLSDHVISRESPHAMR
jgi:hypothetical protein